VNKFQLENIFEKNFILSIPVSNQAQWFQKSIEVYLQSQFIKPIIVQSHFIFEVIGDQISNGRAFLIGRQWPKKTILYEIKGRIRSERFRILKVFNTHLAST